MQIYTANVKMTVEKKSSINNFTSMLCLCLCMFIRNPTVPKDHLFYLHQGQGSDLPKCGTQHSLQ